MTRTRQFILGALVALCGVVIALVLAEVAIRLSGYGEVSFYVYDSNLGWKPRAGAQGWQKEEGIAFVKMNREGFRGPEVSVEKPRGTYRIVVLGDSFTEAKQVDYAQTFCAVLQRELSKPGRIIGRIPGIDRVEVLDLGCDSYGTAQELITLERRAKKYSPDFVLLAIYTGNDVRNNSVALEGDRCRPFWVVDNGQIVLAGPFDASWWFRTQCRARFDSRHFQVLNALGKARDVIKTFARGHEAKAAPASATRVAPLSIDDLVFRPPAGPIWVEAWQVTDWEISQTYREATAHGAGFLAVTLSDPMQALPDPAKRARYQQRLGVANLFYPDEHIAADGRRDGFAVLNLAELFQKYADQHHVCLHGFPNAAPCAGHWNARGHQLAGETIANSITQLASSRHGDSRRSPVSRQSAALYR